MNGMQKTKTSVADAVAQIYKNVKMGVSSVTDLLPKVKDETLRAELLAHLEGYESFARKAESILRTEHREAEEANAFTRFSAKMGTMMNTAMDSTASHIAEMIIEGATMGVTDQMRILHELQRSEEEAEDAHYRDAMRLAADVISFEETMIGKMKKYL